MVYNTIYYIVFLAPSFDSRIRFNFKLFHYVSLYLIFKVIIFINSIMNAINSFNLNSCEELIFIFIPMIFTCKIYFEQDWLFYLS